MFIQVIVVITSSGFEPDKNLNVGAISLHTAKEHLFARMLVERAEEIQSLTLTELQSKLAATYGQAAWDILVNLFKEDEIPDFIASDSIVNLFELCNYVKLQYTDLQIRRSLISGLSLKFVRIISEKGLFWDFGLDFLAYVTDAIAFLSKSKIQFVEDFERLFPIHESSVDHDFGAECNPDDLIKLIRAEIGVPKPSAEPRSGKHLRIRDFSASLHEAALMELAAGSFKANLTNQKKRGWGGKTRNYGEKAYWDIFFWLCPGLWVRKNLSNLQVEL
jgi:hypothetical protein